MQSFCFFEKVMDVYVLKRERYSMDVMDAINTRKSVRSYLARPVEDEKLNAVLEAARLAPSVSNLQEWRFVIVREL